MQLTKDEIDALLKSLDGIAREHDSYDYGLPLDLTDGLTEQLRGAVKTFYAAHTAKVLEDVEPVGFMFQHGETGRITFVDAWQKENGWALANPRYSEVGTMHGASTVASLTAQRDQALARVAELEKDAARYQWLRDGDICADYPYPVMRTGGWQDGQTIWADELDAAIDDAISAAQHPQQEQPK